MDKKKMNQLCKLAIARIESRKILGQNHKRLKGIKFTIKKSAADLVTIIQNNLSQKYNYGKDIEVSGKEILNKAFTYEELPTGASLITTPEELTFYKLCYAIVYKSTKFINRGTAGSIKINQGYSYEKQYTNIVIEHIADLSHVADEVFKNITDLALANNSIPETVDPDTTESALSSFRYRHFNENHKVGLGHFNYSCFDYLTHEAIKDLYQKTIQRKCEYEFETIGIETRWHETGRVSITGKPFGTSSTYTNYAQQGINFYTWKSRRDKNIPKDVVDSYSAVFREWLRTHQNYIAKECSYQKGVRIKDAIRNGLMPI
jgi:hypothetical protein